MKLLPASFEETAYFKNEYRGDLIVTEGVLYYFPHTRVSAARFDNDVLGARGKVENVAIVGELLPFAGAAPTLYAVANNAVKLGRFLKRVFRPSMNSPRIGKLKLENKNISQKDLQRNLDQLIVESRKARLEFEEDSVPKPMRFAAEEIENAKFGLKFTFDAKYDNHDFRVNLMLRGKLKAALVEGGFIK